MKFKLALCQMKGHTEKAAAHAAACTHIREAAGNGARVIGLPEIWNCPYSNKYFRAFAEDEAGESVRLMARLAKENGVWLIGGSIPELADDKIYNTCYIFSPEGQRIGKYRKIHLFDIDVKGSVRFMESETLSAGDRRTLIDTEFGKIGVAICYDVRFPELFTAMAADGARLIVLPGAFTVPTGAAHWELLMRARALDNRIYFAACSPARDLKAPYHAYGHSCIVTPWGDFCGKTDARESIVYGDIDFDYLEEIRAQIPLQNQRRPEAYALRPSPPGL
ncbi:MAG: carbon-nitrogen hydrolase family protein [Clostridiales Family XIII bacterium]|jgi:predicted amidohydrolase|nr:carbon-nitrogen hydrolase family protein [Clostridiales Family XIII bacterium]